MNRVSRAIAGALSVAALAAIGSFAAPASAEEVIPVEVIATITPVYHEGRAHYWWHDRWWYRDGARWSYHRTEPVFLRDWRARNPHRWHYYGRR
jgi:hypothetical protein